MNKTQTILILSILVCLMVASCNNKQPFKLPYEGAVGTVIGKETCNADTGKDYWLVDVVSPSSVRKQYGDTIIINVTKYFNLIKMADLPKETKKNRSEDRI